LIYSKFAPTYWDVVDQTALAQADIEEKDVEGVECEIIFDICSVREDGNGGISSAIKVGNAKIMTTRPEMLPACYVVLYHPEDERYNGSQVGEEITFKNDDGSSDWTQILSYESPSRMTYLLQIIDFILL
jgi:valyl-tRNA synthetase